MSLSKFSYESHRLVSFKDFNKPCCILPHARLGFYFNSKTERLCCYQCSFSIAAAEVENNDILIKHSEYSRSCSTASDHDNNNILMKVLTADCETRMKPETFESFEKKRKSTRDKIDSCVGHTETDCDTVEQPPFRTVCRNILKRGIEKGIIRTEIDPNQPDYNLLKSERIRLSTFTNWPTATPVTKEDLARNGFYYLGIGDRVQCVFCRGFLKNWAPDDKVDVEHRRHFSSCPFVMGQNVGNDAIEDGTNDGSFTAMAAERTRPDVYRQDSIRSHEGASVDGVNRTRLQHTAAAAARQQPVLPPDAQLMLDEQHDAQRNELPTYPVKHRQFVDKQTRKQTFMFARGQLPRGQNVDTLVDAGFFHVGPLDNVKCFCCDVGLKNWQNDDDPWVEHARWSPRCAFLIEKRGQEFIRETLANRQRWVVQANQNLIQLPSLNVEVEPSNMSMLGSISNTRESGNTTVDSVQLPDVGFNEQLLGAPGARVLDQRPANDIQVHFDEDEAREARRQRQQNAAINAAAAAAAGATDGINVENDPEAENLLAENQQLRQVRTCKVCMDQEVNIVFLPCGHLVCCETCAPNLRSCAICRQYIRGTVKVFLS